MPLSAPSISLTKTNKSAFVIKVTAPSPTTLVDIYIKNPVSYSQDYAFFATRTGSGDITVTNRIPNSYQFVYAVSRSAGGELSLPVFDSVDLNVSNSIGSAVRRHWYVNRELTAKVKGGIYINEVPENLEGRPLQMPYCMFRHDKSDFDYAMSDIYFESCNVEFAVFAPGAAVVDESLDLIQKHFDFKSLDFGDTGDFSLSVMPVDRSLNSENFRYKDGNLIFRGSLTYDIVLTRVR